MLRLRLIILAILLAIPFAYFVDLSIYEIAFIEVSELSLLGLRIFGLFFTGAALVYSLFWLERSKIFQLLKQIFLLVIVFEVFSIVISYTLVYFFSFSITDFQVQASDTIQLTKQDILARVSPLFLLKHPVLLWFSFCFIVGISLPKLFSNRFQINTSLTVLMSAMKQIFRVFEYFAPIPIFFLVVMMLKANRFELSYEMGLYIFVYLTGAFAFIFYLIPLVWGVTVKASTLDFYRLMVYPSIFAFGFGDVAAALPIFFFLASDVTSHLNDKEKTETAGIIIPFAYTFFPIANSLLLAIPLLVLKVTGQTSEIYEHLNYTFVGIFILGTPSAAGPGVISILFDILKLPQDSTGVYVEVLPVISHIHAFVHSFSIGFIFLFILSEKQSLKQFSFRNQTKRILKYLIFLGVGLVILFFGIQSLSQIKEKSDAATMNQLEISEPVGKVSKDMVKNNKVRTLQEIIQSKVLRVGYQKNSIPFSYQNIQGEIVGFDIELAHLLAKDLNSQLQLVEVNYSNVTDMVENGEVDIAMGALSVTVERLKKINFSTPVVIAEKVLVVKDYQRYGYDDPDLIIADKEFKVAFLQGSSFEGYAKNMFPNAQYVPLKSYKEFLKKDVADALYWSRQEAYHWTLIHPNYTMVSLSNYPPPTKDILAFGISYQASELAPFINHWLQLKENNQVLDELRDKWKVPVSLP